MLSPYRDAKWLPTKIFPLSVCRSKGTHFSHRHPPGMAVPDPCRKEPRSTSLLFRSNPILCCFAEYQEQQKELFSIGSDSEVYGLYDVGPPKKLKLPLISEHPIIAGRTSTPYPMPDRLAVCLCRRLTSELCVILRDRPQIQIDPERLQIC